MNRDDRFAVVAGGGTGGHVFPALAVARALVARGHPAATIELVGSRRGQEPALLAGEGFPFTLLPGRGLVRRWSRAAARDNAGALCGLIWATCHQLVDLARRRPRVVVSVGGYASFATDVAAVVLGVPLVLVNVDAVPGLVHRLLARRAAANAVAFAATRLPRAVVTGTAVRREITEVDRSSESRAKARAALGLPPDRSLVGVVGGSLGARRLNLAAVDLARRWHGRTDLSLYHVTGRRDWNEVAERGPRPDELDGLSWRVVPFEQQMARLYEAADLMICRAGANTVAELAVAGVPSVLVPLPGAPGDHQTANARALEQRGAALVVTDDRCDAAHLGPIVDDLLADPGRLEAMGESARSLARPDAADRVAELVETHAR